MLTPSVFWQPMARQHQRSPARCVIWKEEGGCWDFFTATSSLDDADKRVHMDSTMNSLDRSHYKVMQG